MRVNKRFLSVLLAGTMAIGMVLPVKATGIKESEKQQQQLENEKKEAEAEQKSLEAKLNKIISEMNEAQRKLSEKEDEIEQTEEELVNAMVNERTQYERMKVRIRYMYESGGTDFLEVLFSAKNMADLLNRAEYISILSRHDKEIFTEFQNIVKEVKEKEQMLKEDYEALTVLQEELSGKRGQVETLIEENAQEIAGLESKIKQVQDDIAKAKEAERRRQEAEEAKKPSGGNSTQTGSQPKPQPKPQPPVVSGNGYFTHPCPGMSYQSSYFGEIRQGIGDPTPHKGHDYAAPAGTPIYAAAAGTVLIAGYSNSAGNWVVIDHGGGLVTKYMHMCSTPYVSAGQQVTKGQHIGGVGTTGQSTGNHLHFQVEENGVAVNPSKYM